MSTSATGRLVDENGAPWRDLVVTARDDALLRPFELGHSEPTTGDGRFTILYDADQLGGRTLRFQVLDTVRRVLHGFEREDVEGATLALGDVEIKRSDGDGFLVTLGTGAQRFLSRGNAVKLLVDDEGFQHVAKLIKGAESFIHLTQLYFNVPPSFQDDPTAETPALVFQFVPDNLTAAAPRPVGPNDVRPERILSEKSSPVGSPDVDVKVLLNRFELIGGAGLVALYSIIGIGFIAYLEAGGQTDVDEVTEYFARDTLSNVRVAEFRQQAPHPMHGKLVVVDGSEAVSLGSPFRQGYFDRPAHAVEEPRRGSGSKPQHDVSLAVRGPAVSDLHEVFALHWNTAVPSDPVQPAFERPMETEGDDPIAAVQVVRTLTEGRFEGLDKGEKGILEAYLRAIAQAREIVYLETQYFTNDAIGDALVAALKARSELQVIMLLNIKPDVLGYPFGQKRLVGRMRESLGPEARKRFGVFTRWSHDISSTPPRIVPVYLHTKTGFVDDRWATVGSANLDGTSLDFIWLMSKLGMGEERATETNVLIFNGVDGLPATSAVDQLRRRLWSEHLGLDEADLVDAPPGGWLELWTQRAKQKLDLLKSDPTSASLCEVLSFPEIDEFFESFDKPRKHLTKLGVDTNNRRLDPLLSVPGFDLKTGTWSSKATLDPQRRPHVPPPGG